MKMTEEELKLALKALQAFAAYVQLGATIANPPR